MQNIKMPQKITAEIFRAYDIRGIVDDQLTAEIAYAVGLALGTQLQRLQKTTAVVARDARPSSLGFQQALIQGLRECGCDVLDIGLVATPVLYFAAYHLKDICFGSGFMITGSHNPTNYNGIKMMLAGKTLHSDAIAELYQQILNKDFLKKDQAQWGGYKQQTILDVYQDTVCKRVNIARPLRVVIDAGNGMAGELAPSLYRKLGCEVDELYCELDGNFPNHHPDPTIPENLQDLMAKVKQTGADCGLAFDGDADRLGVVTPGGDIIWPDQQMMFYAEDLLSRQPGATIVYDVKCSRYLPEVITAAGGKPLMSKTGHSLLKAKMLEVDAGMAGEMSGHIFFREDWFGFDDGVYAGARFLQILAAQQKSCQELYDALPKGVVTPELKIMVAEDKKENLMKKITDCQTKFAAWEQEAEIHTIDGVRVDFSDGFALLRASNTTPCVIARFEAKDASRLSSLQQYYKKILLEIEPSLEVPF